jgi:isoquinoline 1-oxidoreductase alpha subunit
MSYRLVVNGKSRVADVDGDTPLLWVLRDSLGLTGTKFGGGVALCGACTVHVNGEARRSCVSPIAKVGSARIGTIEALGDSPVGRALQRAWLDLEVVQCGYCQPGQLMSAAALLAANPSPSDEDIDAVMSGNICRCGTYGRIRAGIKLAAGYLASAGAPASNKGAS